jgi:acyl dehydratase
VRTFASLEEFAAAQGEELGHSQWHEVTQEQINAFADATGDHQWIHVDIERAANGPFKSTIAHGYLTVSMLSVMVAEIYRIEGLAMGINYGLDRLRFPHPVLVGSRIRASAKLTDVRDAKLGKLAYCRVTVAAAGLEKAVCVADTVSLLVPGPA